MISSRAPSDRVFDLGRVRQQHEVVFAVDEEHGRPNGRKLLERPLRLRKHHCAPLLEQLRPLCHVQLGLTSLTEINHPFTAA
jgi:hypothetical protein